MQRNLFPGFAEDLGVTTDKHLAVIIVFDMVRVEKFMLNQNQSFVGRPLISREALARAFIAKAVLNIPTTVGLIDRLKVDQVLRRLCGFNGKLPSEGTFSNSFAEFAKLGLAALIHEALVREIYKDKIVGHVCRDATAIDGREKPARGDHNPNHCRTIFQKDDEAWRILGPADRLDPAEPPLGDLEFLERFERRPAFKQEGNSKNHVGDDWRDRLFGPLDVQYAFVD